MGWFIHHVNIQAHDVPQSVAFYRDVIGLTEGEWAFPAGANLGLAPDTLAVFGSHNRGIHIVRGDQGFQQRHGLAHNPTIGGHFAVNVTDADAVKARLEAAGHIVSDAGTYAMAGVRQLYVWDPSYNLVEINEIVDASGGPGPGADEAHGRRMEADGWHLHHINIEVHDVPAAAAFYRDLIGITGTAWVGAPDSPIADVTADPSLLAPFGSGDNRGLHVVRPQPGFAKRNGLDHNPTIAGHFALQLDDLAAAARRLDAAGILYSDAGCYAMAGLRQLYLYDPSMNLVELNGPA
jgi:catechol 2,3-dioxygenase-like lactoylglutathione lyase family enzyme